MTPTRDLTTTARQLLEDVDLFRLPVVPKEVCSRLGIHYREVPFKGIEGTLVVIGDQQMISVNSRTREATRKAFTCAHELGHYTLDLDNGPTQFTCSSSDILGQSDRKTSKVDPKEIRANAFAAELLMPAALVLPLIRGQNPSWDLIRQLASTCGVSLQMAAQRYIELTDEPCWFVVLRRGWVQRYSRSDHAEQHILTARSVPMPKTFSGEWQAAPAKIWFGRHPSLKGKAVYDALLPENSYGETLALVWDRHGLLSGGRSLGSPWFWVLAILTIFWIVVQVFIRSQEYPGGTKKPEKRNSIHRQRRPPPTNGVQ
jgi:Zn-dependent peptidase ImmA (M78 family)